MTQIPQLKDRDRQSRLKSQLHVVYENPTLTLNVKTQVKRKRMEKFISCYGNKNKARVSIIFSEKIDLRTGKIIRKKEGQYIMSHR